MSQREVQQRISEAITELKQSRSDCNHLLGFVLNIQEKSGLTLSQADAALVNEIEVRCRDGNSPAIDWHNTYYPVMRQEF